MLDDIEVADAKPVLALAEVNAMIATLDEAQRNCLQSVFELMVQTITNKRGSMVVVVDVFGMGHAQMLALGNTEMVPHLLDSTQKIANHLYKPETGDQLQ